MTTRIIQGAPGWFFHAVVDGSDLVVRGALATWFGGDDDPQDDGSTASGVNTKDNPGILGCALPIPAPGFAPTLGTPLPRFPWQTQVIVTPWGSQRSVVAPLIDIGPAKSTFHGIDLTQASFLAAGGDLSVGILSVDYRVIGGAAFLT
jgi:hypothetical protein